MAMLCTKIHKSNLNKEDQESYDRINKGNKLFLCFRPVIMDGSDYVNRGRGHSNSFARYVQMEDKDGVIFAHLYSDLPSSAASSFSSQTEKEVDGHRKKKSKRKFLRAIKAVLFETSLAKKIKKKAFPRKSKQSTTPEAENNVNPENEDSPFQKSSMKSYGTTGTFAPSMNSCAWSSRNPSLNSPNSMLLSDKSLPLESYNNLMEIKKNQELVQEENGKVHGSATKGLVLLLVTLVVLVFWGKLYAILCTSTWLFLVPNWNSGKKFLKIMAKSHSMDLDERKKKTFMEVIFDSDRRSPSPLMS